MQITQSWLRPSETCAAGSRATSRFIPLAGHAARAAIGKHLEAKKNQDLLAVLSERDETLVSAMRSGLKRIRSWRVPPNWSRGDWFEELGAVATAAAWQAICDFDPERGIPLAGFGYCRMISCCLARYRKEWRYALHLDASETGEKETTTFKDPDPPVAKVNGTHHSSGDLRGAVGALPAQERQLIEQLFWNERTETELANALGKNQSTINRHKRTILKSLRMKLCDGNGFQKICIKLLVVSNLTDWLTGLADAAVDVALGA